MRVRLRAMAASHDPLYFTVLTGDGAVGTASYLRIAPEAGSAEVGWISFSPLLQRTPAATEAMALMMARIFDLGYRRYEWKCDALNAPSSRRRRNGWASPTRARSGRRRWSRAATATPPGSRSSTGSGRR